MFQKHKFNQTCKGTTFESVYKKRRKLSCSEEMSTVVSLAVIFVLCCPSVIQGAFRYNLESCSDLVPKHITERFPDTYEYNEPTPSWQNGNGDGYRRRNRRETYNDSPFRITVSAKRYRKDANIYGKPQSEFFLP